MSDEPDIEASELVENHDVRSKPGAEDGYSTALYRTPHGRHFIHIIHSDMNSKYNGALGFDQWVEDDQVLTWKDL